MSRKPWKRKVFLIAAAAAAAFAASEGLAANVLPDLSPEDQYIRFNSELNCVEARVRASPPGNSAAKGAGKALEARERAELLFYVRLVDFLFGAQIEGWDARTSTVRSTEGKNQVDRLSMNAVWMKRKENISGYIMRNVKMSKGRWDGYSYEIYGRLSMSRTPDAGKKTEELGKPAESGQKKTRSRKSR
jgi:hypothetical protein